MGTCDGLGYRRSPQAESWTDCGAATELGLGWPESAHRWTGTPGRAASLDCSEGSLRRERDAAWARLDRRRVETRGGGPGRAGWGSKHVPLGADGALIPTRITGVVGPGDDGIFPVTAHGSNPCWGRVTRIGSETPIARY